ncbi:hypothetical protein [Inhella gelatinilytica]|uniref:Uncharacterized protein n=1 Tax=Inhella gelatinilytica TaxID=2795030 RepID=A0A931N9F6_9BURK|nr:hypothetical protein [Inhella gelatinilytica]MBH9551313.1 hypothetical protein [Inhella gelatinilytica]
MQHSKWPLAALAPLALAGLMVAPGAGAQGTGAGLQIEEAASEAQLGLPRYPKAQPMRDGKDSAGAGAGAFNLSLWGGSFGFRVAVAQFRSGDSVGAIADFYRKAMSSFGPVVACTPGMPRPASAPPEGALQCKASDVPAGGVVLKVGRAKNLRVVVIQPEGKETQFQLMRIEAQ